MKKVVSIVLAFILIWTCVFSAAAVETQIGKNINYDVTGDGRVDLWDQILISLSGDPYTVGDANNDGNVNLTDYTVLKTYIETGVDNNIDTQADVNEDGAYDAFDLFMLDKWISLGAQTTYNN